MAASVQISETNGATVVYDNIGNSNMGSTDAHDLVAATYPITAGQNSFEKYQRFKLVDKSTSTCIKNLKVWRSGTSIGSDVHKTNARTSGYVQKSYVAPTASTSTQADQDMPTSVPAGANLGIGGSLTGELTTNGTYSDYLVHQLQVNAATVAGVTATMNYQYDEVA